MQSKEIDDFISFAGHSSKDCEEFIRKITKAAFHECFLRDDERVAALAAAGLEGKALRWFEKLPTSSGVRTDWQLLRQYMLDEWSSDTDSESEAEDPPPAYSAALTEVTRMEKGYVNPTSPVLASKTYKSQPRGGAIALVLDGQEKPESSWFISPPIDGQSNCSTGSSWLEARYALNPDDTGSKIELVNGSSWSDTCQWKYLAVAEIGQMESSGGWGAITAVTKDNHGGLCAMGKRPVQHEVWTLEQDGTVNVAWQTYLSTLFGKKRRGPKVALHPVVDTSGRIYLTCTPDKFIAENGQKGIKLSKARLVFVPPPNDSPA